jgi:hypothetical protein
MKNIVRTTKAIRVLIKNRKNKQLIETLMILNVYFKSPMNQTELARATGFTQQAISLIVRGERRADHYGLFVTLASNMFVGVIMDMLLKRKFVKTYGDPNSICYKEQRPQ